MLKATSLYPKVNRNIFFLFTFSFLPLFYLTSSENDLTEIEAILKAEQFINENGYTSFPVDKSKIERELMEGNINIDTLIKYRRNSLHEKAFCISEDKTEWHVGFLYSNIKVESLDSLTRQSDLGGRAVIISKDGKEIRIAHKTPLFSHFKKL